MKILTKPCLQCGTTITKPQTESLKNWGVRHKYCSRSCMGRYLHKTKLYKYEQKVGDKAINPIKKGQHLSPKTQFKKGHIPWSKLHPELMPEPWNKGKRHPSVTGEKHPNWKGGISGLNAQVRGCPEMIQWRKQIFKRDDYTCVLCKRKRKPEDRVVLNADHHPKLFYLILEENNITTFEQAIACEELWDIKNGRTLCVECHLPTKGVNQHTK